MRELTQTEVTQISGGDGMKLPGGGYISGTSKIFAGLSLFGAVTTAYSVGYAIGTGINYGLDAGGISLGGMAYDRYGSGS